MSKCILCAGEAEAVAIIPEGCVALPDTVIQPRCAQHVVKCDGIGDWWWGWVRPALARQLGMS